VCDTSLTRTIPERFRDEYLTHYKALYKCLVYFSGPRIVIHYVGVSVCQDISF